MLGPRYLDEERMWQDAAWRAQNAVAVGSDDAFAWFNLGASLAHLAELQGNEAFYGRAAAAFDRARAIGLPWRMLWYRFEPYVAYLGAGRADEVLQLTDAMLTNGGGQNVEETYLYRGQALLGLGREDEARAAFERARRLNPTSGLVQQMLASSSGG